MAFKAAEGYLQLSLEKTNRLTKDVDTAAHKASDAAEKTFTSRFGSIFKSIGSLAAKGLAVMASGAVLAAGGLGVLVKQSVDAARDIGETTSKVGVLFGNVTDGVGRFADQSARKLGQSAQSAMDAAATFAIFGKGAGLTGEKLLKFSTGLTTLASDMASFSNSSPQEAVIAMGSAMRGEFDPIERYGVLLNETNVKQRALEMGLIKTTKNALTPQQRVLAVQAEIFRQTTAAQGDFARTSGGLANQQRILTAQWHDQKTAIGGAFLPVITTLTTQLNNEVMPAFREMWSKHGPQVAAIFAQVGQEIGKAITNLLKADWGAIFDKIGNGATKISGAFAGVDWSSAIEKGTAALEKLGPQLSAIGSAGGEGAGDTLTVMGVAFGFLADHAGTLADIMPALAAGFVAYKVAQTASNIAALVSVPVRLAEVVATRQQTAALAANSAALGINAAASGASTAASGADAAATNAGVIAKTRAVAGMVAHRVAMVASAVATGAVTAATWLWNAALYANPVGLVILGILLLVGVFILLWNKFDWFRNFFINGWKAIVIVAQWVWTAGIKPMVDKIVAAWNWLWNAVSVGIDVSIAFVKAVIASLKATWERDWSAISAVVSAVWGAIKAAVSAGIAFVTGLWGRIKDAAATAWNAARDAVTTALGSIRSRASDAIDGVINFFSGLGGRLVSSGKALIEGFLDGIRQMAGKAVQAAKDVVGKVRDVFPFSPAKEGPFSGRGWVLYSGMSIGESFAEGIEKKMAQARIAASQLASAAQMEFSVPQGGLAMAGAPATNVQVRVLIGNEEFKGYVTEVVDDRSNERSGEMARKLLGR